MFGVLPPLFHQMEINIMLHLLMLSANSLGYFPFNANLAVQDSDFAEPTFYSNAVKILEWRQAMQTEFNGLLQNQTWTLVPPQQATNLVGCKWVFKVKRKADGSIE
jgi:hypothetical protein